MGAFIEGIIAGSVGGKGVDFLSMGFSKVAVDKFTLASEIDISEGSNTLPHSLGEKPKMALCVTADTDSLEDYRVFFIYGFDLKGNGAMWGSFEYKSMQYNSSGAGGSSAGYGFSRCTESNVTLPEYASSMTYLPAGVEFTLITAA